jgi:hypothetical protein
MTTCMEDTCLTITGCAFEIQDHWLMIEWAKCHDHRAVVRLDHGVASEEYEEVVELLFGVRNRCRFIIWRTVDAVFVQPLIGRKVLYASVAEALAAISLKRAYHCYSAV